MKNGQISLAKWLQQGSKSSLIRWWRLRRLDTIALGMSEPINEEAWPKINPSTFGDTQ